MTRIRQHTGMVRLALGSALAAAMLAGCAGAGHIARSDSGAARLSTKGVGKAVARAEAAAARKPDVAALRVALGHAYLDAGRFESAADAFADAMTLGDASGATALSLALAQVASGDQGSAVATLDQWREAIPAGDFGLALALAGETSRGVAILADALRAGEDTPKLRQNLAYAYALDGRWREARLMAAQDVPADQLDQRISSWAVQGKPEDYRQRVASLLAVPLRTDEGQPEALALNAGGSEARFAAAEPAPLASPVRAELAPLAQPELPALPDDSAPRQADARFVDADDAPASFAAAFAAPAADRPDPMDQTRPGFISRAVIQELPARSLERDRAANARLISRAGTDHGAASGKRACDTHLVQLGSFLSEARARKAWDIYVSRNAELRNYRMTITPAVVEGRNFWRVAAAGLDAGGARSLCSSVKGRGGACIAYAAERPLPGAVSPGGASGVRKARR